MQAQFRVAHELGCTLEVVKSMSSEEFLGWLEYFSWVHEQERKAFKDAKKGKRR